MLGIKGKNMNDGLCECGCGQKTSIAKKTRSILGHKKGIPVRFINGHNSSLYKGSLSHNWKGGFSVDRLGYKIIRKIAHPKAHNGYIYEHIFIAEKVLGKALPLGAVVHHIDGKTGNNKNSNLVICENNAYHLFLHQRQRAYKNCGYPHWRKCNFCKEYDDPANLYLHPNQAMAYHKACIKKYHQKKI